MKRLLILLLFGFCMIHSAKSQVKIGDNPQNIDAASVLELQSTEKVLVITRVTTAQMNAISPLQGALVYNTDLQGVHYYDGTQWVNIGAGGGTGGLLTADPIVNDVSTIAITPTANGDNLEVAPNSIGTLQIANGGVNGTDDIQDNSIGPNKIQDQSVTQEKLSENSVGAFALDNDNIGVSAFNNDVGYITSANIVSADAGNALQIGTDNGAFYDELPLINALQDNADAIQVNADAIALDMDQSASNEIQNLTLTGAVIGLTNTAGTIDIGPLIAAGGGDPTDELTDISFNTTTNILSLSNSATPAGGQVDLSTLAGGVGTTEVADQTTITGLGTAIDPFKIEPGGNGQFLTTDTGGTIAWATVTPGGGSQNLGEVLTTGNDGGASLIRNILDPLLPQDAATRAYVDATVTSGGPLTDGTILIGDATNAAQQLSVSGDATLANNGQLTIATDAINTGKILNATILAEDLNDMGATNGQVLKWDVATTTWITADDDTGTAALNDGNIYVGDVANTPQGVFMSGDALIDNTGALTIQDDAIELNMIAQNGATADGEVIQWNNVTSEWEVGVNAGHTGTANNVFFAGADGKPIGTEGNDVVGDPNSLRDNGGFYWDKSKRANTGALYLGLKGNGNDQGTSTPGNHSKLVVAEKLPNLIAFPIQMVNEGNTSATGTGILFANTTTGNPGGAALIFERIGAQGQGDFHFLSSTVGGSVRPAYTDKVFTVENDGDVVLTGDIIGKNGAGVLGQVLTTTAAGTEWAGVGGGTNLATDNLIQDTEPRTYNISGQTLTFLGGKVGIGTGTIDTGADVALHVLGNGQVRSAAFVGPGTGGTGGSALNPTFRFNSVTKNDGMYLQAEDELAFSAGGEKIVSFEWNGLDGSAIFTSKVELDEELIDINGDAGTSGQVLSSTGAGVDWVDPAADLIIKGQGTTDASGESTIVIPAQANTNYVINLTVRGTLTDRPYTIQVSNQQLNSFSVQVFEQDPAGGGFFSGSINAVFHYTVFKD